MNVSNEMRVADFVAFIRARHSIYLARQAGLPKPWTTNAILQRYRFCNVYRELDVVTKWIAENWREPLGACSSPNLWFWMLVARLVNNPSTLTLMTNMALSEKWSANKFISVVERVQSAGRKAWGGAYIVSTNGRQMPKAEYIATHVLDPAWTKRKKIQPTQHDSLYEFCRRLLTLNGVQGFIAGQVIADAKYADEDLMQACDWHTFAVSGPGSRRGLNRVYGFGKDSPWSEGDWHYKLAALREAVNSDIKGIRELEFLHAQDIQNCLCEFDKYERVRLGEGRPRSTYPGV